MGRYGIFAFVCLPLFVTALQFHMVSVALPQMIDELHAPLRWVGWVLTIYTISSAAAMPIMGKLSDEFGRRRIFAAGLTVFALASLACALAPNVWTLIAARLFQGVAAGSLTPSAYGLIGDVFADRRAQALGLISAIIPFGTLLGPNLGGVIVEQVGWRWTFALNVPVGLLLGALALFVLPASERKPAGRVDALGAGLLALGVFALIYSLTELSQTKNDPNVLIVAGAAALSVSSLVIFVRHELRVAQPVIALDLLKQRPFMAANVLNLFYGVALLGLFGFIPLYAQTAYDMSPSESGALLTPRAILMIVSSALAALFIARTGHRKPIAAGLVLMGAGAVVLSLGLHRPTVLGIQFSDFYWLMTVVATVGLAYGLVGPALNNAAIEFAPDRIAAITGLRGMFRSIGGAIGTAVIVLVVGRASSTARGLELAFLGLGIITFATLALTLLIPEPGESREHPRGAGLRETGPPAPRAAAAPDTPGN